MAPKAEAIPFDVAVDRERRFIEQVREMIRDEVRAATKDAVSEMRTTNKVSKQVVERLNNMAQTLAGVHAEVTRCTGWITARAMKEDALEHKLDRFFSLVTPQNPPPSPPEPT